LSWQFKEIVDASNWTPPFIGNQPIAFMKRWAFKSGHFCSPRFYERQVLIFAGQAPQAVFKWAHVRIEPQFQTANPTTLQASIYPPN
jgi:hypothetical protein